MCLKSSYLLKSVQQDYRNHPIVHAMDGKFSVSLSTDDASVLQTNISNEYKIMMDNVKSDATWNYRMIINAANQTFLPEEEKKALIKKLMV